MRVARRGDAELPAPHVLALHRIASVGDQVEQQLLQLDRVAAQINGSSDPIEDIHYLTVLACLHAPRPAGLTKQVAAGLLALDRKVTQRHYNRDRHWPLRLAEVHAELARKDPGLNEALLALLRALDRSMRAEAKA